ncbi:hypothetical protein FA95DRAFT_1558236 [Auriscalpium vulgare]|uniref:Uncharacterized protein n=1 Tax=Auriscalpium vulgare TaxID=40419 RepID=A0ACB8RVF8_9AGAM|nr:hypothetical protein FA95DRAFT_1558236 [Auriscalpium vulgare]
MTFQTCAPTMTTWRMSRKSAFNLINDVNIPQTEAKIAAYRRENAALIERNLQRDEAYAHALKEHEDAERRDRQNRAEELRRAEEEERDAREGERRALIDSLAQSDADAVRLVARSKAEAQKRAAARLSAASHTQSSSASLRSRAVQSVTVPDVPHVPLQDDWYVYEDKFTLRPSYFDPGSDAVRRDREGIMRAGGYRLEDAWERALRSAVAGLDVQPLVGLDLGQSTPAGGGDVVMTFA